MLDNVKGTGVTSIDYSEVYSENEVAQFFNCLPVEAQDELLEMMRKMAAANKAKKVKGGFETCQKI